MGCLEVTAIVRLLLQEFGHFLLHAVGLGQGCDAGLAKDFILGHVGCRGGVVGGLNSVLRGGQVFLLRAHDLADGVEHVDLRADVAILGGNGGDGAIELGKA